MTQARPMRDAPPALLAEPVAGFADTDRAPLSHAPPHLLWASLEDAFVTADGTGDSRDGTDDQRLPGYVGLAITLGLSLTLWAIIVRLVLLR